MTRLPLSAFDLAAHPAKQDPALVAADEQFFAALATSLDEQLAALTERIDLLRRAPGRGGTAALERDQEIHRLTSRRRTLQRYGLDLCLGRMVTAADERVYVGRLGLTGADSERLLVDWRSPAAEPFFGATHGNPMGLASRRRFRWTGGRITDFWDEAFTADAVSSAIALDDQSAFIASLGASRSAQMRDVLGTLQADQDAIIRAGSRGALVVDGGPGTGKTVVAVHRAAYLLYADPHLAGRRGGVLFVGPHEPYLAYVADALPALGEEGVRMCTLRDLAPEGAAALAEASDEVARLKSSAELVGAIERAVAFYERPPTAGVTVETPWADLWLSPREWADVFEAREPGIPHNEARDALWEEVLALLVDKLDDEEAPPAQARRAIARDRGLAAAFNRAWPLLEPTDVVGDLWDVPAYLRLCAPWLTPDEVAVLQRHDAQAWTVADLPLLDAARRRLGDPEASRRNRERERTLAADRAAMDRVVDDLIASDDSELLVMTMLKGADLRGALVDESGLAAADPDVLAGPFAHIVVDEAQELTDAEWQMLLARCPSRSFTVVGDRAQARHGFTESWESRLARVGLTELAHATLSINYRTPSEVMAEAEPVIRAALPDANVPTSVRAAGVPVRHGRVADLAAVVSEWLAAHDEGVACVIGAPDYADSARVRSLAPELVKGLEFDLVVLVDPESFGAGVQGAVDHYVAMTRTTQQLTILQP